VGLVVMLEVPSALSVGLGVTRMVTDKAGPGWIRQPNDRIATGQGRDHAALGELVACDGRWQ
jgi:hypothetical protein